MALEQDLNIVITRLTVVGREHEHALEQELRVVEHVQLQADSS